MNIIHEPLRYAHEDGHTDVCYSSDGDYFMTCGADGDVRIWSVEEGADPTHTCIGEFALSVRHKGDQIYVATGNNEIQILSHPEGERDHLLTRATDLFNQIALCKNKNILALAGEGMEVTIMDLDTNTVKIKFKDLGGPCLSVALCPNASKVAASSGDGYLRVWDIDSESLLKEILCFPKVNSFANSKLLCRLDFEPNTGEILAYPHDNTIKLLNTTSWKEETLSCASVKANYSVLNYSNCGKYLAAATLEGDFVIWETSNLKVYKISKHESSLAICGLMWNPKGNGEIVYTDVEGQLSIMSNCNRLQKIDQEKVDKNGFTEHEVDFGEFIDEPEKDADDAVSVSSLPSRAGSLEPELQSIGERSKASSRASSPRPHSPAIPLQASFMPSSTPEHLDPRYLCWNDVGIVKCYGSNADDELSSKTIEVEFHDSAFHNSMMVQNFKDYTMGSIGRGALAVANSNQLLVLPLTANNKEWTQNLQHETIVLIAASENLVCFASSNYIIRVCSIFGTQRGIVSVPGRVVCMSAFQKLLLVAYHAGPAREGDQCINIKLFKFDGMNVESHDLSSALGPESTLYWLGFSDMGTPAMLDSLGTLSLFPPKCNTWIPFCDTAELRKSPGDHFFVTAVFESYQAVGGIWCKGTVYPGFVPRPMVCELPLQPPFAECSTQKTQLEMSLFTWSNLNITNVERNFKETALKLFALSCKNDLDQRAFELMQILGNQQVLNLALKYSSKVNRKRLSEKLIELGERLRQQNDEDEECSQSVSATPNSQQPEQPVVKPKPARLSLSKLTPKIRKSIKESSFLTARTPENNENSRSSIINTQESIFKEDESQSKDVTTLLESEDTNKTVSLTPNLNPFLKRPKKVNAANPLNLSEKYAGVNYETPDPRQSSEVAEKRKLSDSDSEKPAEKQRKLDKFLFSK
ncbi:WD repeat and HMG-box DNA-binding protein 1 isoform X1 [Euwallacea fornicatus]|uniref:WD repeat and HMG-box DNA-binding protein 1 isoform X1 n=2 Tax=Euwallacea fornicatus TaxID=995702 RepID=UPI00338DCE89